MRIGFDAGEGNIAMCPDIVAPKVCRPERQIQETVHPTKARKVIGEESEAHYSYVNLPCNSAFQLDVSSETASRRTWNELDGFSRSGAGMDDDIKRSTMSNPVRRLDSPTSLDYDNGRLSAEHRNA